MREWLKVLTYKLTHVASVARESAFVQLAAVPGVDEELDGATQGLDGAGEAARAAAQAGQVVAQLRVVGLDAVGLALARRDGVTPGPVDQRRVRWEGVGVVLLRRSRPLKRLLQRVPGAFPDHGIAQDAAGGAIHFRYDVGNVFLCPTKVYSSSSSAVSTGPSGCGGCSGKASACAATQLATV